MFESVMEDMLPWFKVNEPPNRSAGFQTADVLNKQQPVLLACDKVQGFNLQRVDPQLAKHLSSIEFSPQVRARACVCVCVVVVVVVVVVVIVEPPISFIFG
jgi:hypothetical protein